MGLIEKDEIDQSDIFAFKEYTFEDNELIESDSETDPDDFIDEDDSNDILQFAKDFNEQNQEIITYFENYTYTNVLTMLGENKTADISTIGIDFDEEILYDFRRPDQNEDELIIENNHSILKQRPESIFIKDLTIELGTYKYLF